MGLSAPWGILVRYFTSCLSQVSAWSPLDPRWSTLQRLEQLNVTQCDTASRHERTDHANPTIPWSTWYTRVDLYTPVLFFRYRRMLACKLTYIIPSNCLLVPLKWVIHSGQLYNTHQNYRISHRGYTCPLRHMPGTQPHPKLLLRRNAAGPPHTQLLSFHIVLRITDSGGNVWFKIRSGLDGSLNKSYYSRIYFL